MDDETLPLLKVHEYFRGVSDEALRGGRPGFAESSSTRPGGLTRRTYASSVPSGSSSAGDSRP